MDNKPTVTILIPMRNEADFISGCLDSILATSYPLNLLEILILDAMSGDSSKEVVMTYCNSNPNIKIIENSGLIVSKGLNIGIKQAQGEVIIRMDAHAVYDQNYISESVQLLLDSDAQNVGGIVQPVGKSYIGKAIALAMSSRFGVGDAKYRYATEQEYVDTVWCGCWHKKTLESLGGFNEQWIVNQDSELNNRIRQAGGKLLISPKIKCKYFVRDSLPLLAKQYFRYGSARVKTLLAYPKLLKIRQVIPPVFLCTFIITLLLCIWSCWPFVILNGLYFLVSFTVSSYISLSRNIVTLPVLPLIFAIIHFCWAAGFVMNLLKNVYHRLTS